jgi:hypothetical protein
MVTAVLVSFTMEYKGRSGAEISMFYKDLYRCEGIGVGSCTKERRDEELGITD